MKKHLSLFLLIASVNFSCRDSNTNTLESTSNSTTTTNTTINGDTAQTKSPESTEAQIIQGISEIAKEFYDEWEQNDSVRDANESHKWAYIIGDSYDDDGLAGKDYDRYKETEPDLFIFKKKRKRFYLIKGNGSQSRKNLEDSLEVIQKRLNARLEIIDLSKACRKSVTITDDVKYRNDDNEKKYAPCKKCE